MKGKETAKNIKLLLQRYLVFSSSPDFLQNISFLKLNHKKMNLFLKNSLWILLLAMPLLVFNSCDDDDPVEPTNEIKITASATAADDAQLAFIEVEEEFVITFEEGTFSFTNTLSMDGKSKVIVRGAGQDKTFLDFKGQTSGGEGVLISNSNSIRFENLTIRDSKGDALKARDCNKISFVNVGTIWSGEPSEDNGAYGLYPVLCTEVYIDNCYAYGASDAGIYVGQSDQVILKNSVAEGNVAGIEIENTTNADVFDNEAFDNTGGILVFDLPGLTKYGNNCRIFNNNVHDNERTNFAPEGNIVASVPTGTGIMLMSTENVEIFNNTLTNNSFANILVVSYLVFRPQPDDPNYNPFPTGVSIHDNDYTLETMVNAEVQTDFVKQIIGLLQQYGFGQPNILVDGLVMGDEPMCIEDTDTSFVNLNASDQTFQSVNKDLTPFTCMKDPLPEISFEEY